MVASHIGKGKIALIGLASGIFAILFGVLFFNNPVHAQANPAANPQASSTEQALVTLSPVTTPGRGDDEKVCTTGDGLAGNIAYVLCPVVQLIADATSFFETKIILPFMTISPLTTSDKNAIYIMWQNMRSFANVGFILFFFFIILSQATSLGLSNYGIKKVLPRLLIVAIGINLSYFIVAFVIDAFNIFGGGISSLVVAALKQGSIPLTSTAGEPEWGAIFIVGGAALATVVATAGAALGWVFGLIGLAFMFILVTVLVLVVRQIAIVLLVIIAPVAILMYMLPNTENYFNKWRKNLTQLLMMYPILVLLFAAGKIFGVIINQPDFKIGLFLHGFATILTEPLNFLAQATGGTGVEDTVKTEITNGAKTGISIFVNAAPLGASPVAYQLGGMATSKIGNFAHGKFVAPRAQQSMQDLNRIGAETRVRAAKIPGVGIVAGHGLRKKAIRSARETNLQRDTEQYVAGQMASSPLMRFRAGGVAGGAGRTRAAAGAAGVAAKGRKEDLDNEMALLDAEMRRLGTNSKTFSGAIGKYLENPDDTSTHVFTGANGKTFNFATQGQGLQKALLNSAASQGEIKAIEAARMSSNVDQTDLDDIIRNNESKLKEKGGYHLATNYNLAAGRDFNTSTEAGRKAASAEMHAQRIVAMAQTGANSIAGMKAGVLGGTADILNPDPTNADAVAHKAEVLARVDAASAEATSRTKKPTDYRDMLFKRMGDIKGNNNTLARAEVPDTVFTDIESNIK